MEYVFIFVCRRIKKWMVGVMDEKKNNDNTIYEILIELLKLISYYYILRFGVDTASFFIRRKKEYTQAVDILTKILGSYDKITQQIEKKLDRLDELILINFNKLSNNTKNFIKKVMDELLETTTVEGQKLFIFPTTIVNKTQQIIRRFDPPPRKDTFSNGSKNAVGIKKILDRVLNYLSRAFLWVKKPIPQRPQGSAASPQNQSRRGFLKTASK